MFKQSAPVIKLPAEASEDDHLALLGLLNSSTACFWMKQTFHNKGSTVDSKGARQTTDAFENFYEHTGTGLKQFPIPETKPLDLATQLDQLASERQAHLPAQLAASLPLTRAELDGHRADASRLLGLMMALQEELDWRCYQLYGVSEQRLCYQDHAARPLSPPPINLGERAFEIVMARKMAKGELQTTWFERHGSTPITELPEHWPADYRELVMQRLALIESDRNIGLIESPEFKRRWNQDGWEAQEQDALRDWLLDRLETAAYWSNNALQTTARLAEQARRDLDFMQVAELYRAHVDFDVAALVAELVVHEAEPFLPVLRYKPAGLRKRQAWEDTWALQRAEDAIDAEVKSNTPRLEDEDDDTYGARIDALAKARKADEIGDISPPPKYKAADFLNATFWRLRGALDVPKERFVSYPHCSPAADESLLFAWAGWNSLEQAQALSAHYLDMKEREGWVAPRLIPLLTGLGELIPWLKQWHNELDPTYGVRMGDYFEDFATEEARELGVTSEEVTAWTAPAPARTTRKTKRKKAASNKALSDTATEVTDAEKPKP